jgi:hypothetical protein
MNPTQEIKNIRIKNNCSANWNTMRGDPDGKFCQSCKKVVHDFTDKHAADFQKIYEEQKGNLCGRFLISQTTLSYKQPNWKRILSAFLLVFGYNLVGSDLKAQTTHQGSGPDTTKKQNTAREPMVMGDYEAPQAEYKYGGQEGMMKFLKDNIRFSEKCPDGKLFVSFVVDSVGRVRSPEILKSGLDAETNKDALRVISLLEFTPAQFLNKSISTYHTLPVIFKRKDWQKCKWKNRLQRQGL